MYEVIYRNCVIFFIIKSTQKYETMRILFINLWLRPLNNLEGTQLFNVITSDYILRDTQTQ